MKKIYPKIIKRLIDVLMALLLITPGLPLLLLGILLIKLDSSGPAFFTQERIGYHNKPFTIYKLRTMSLETHKGDKRIKDRNRITKAGKIVRKFSVDELPQLFNILKGDMSFIGPRPLLPRYFPYYTDFELRRHEARPGITGLAQIRGRSNIQWEERFKYDIYYVDNISFLLDLRILIGTIKSVVSGKNTSVIRPPGLVDFDEHRGYKKNR